MHLYKDLSVLYIYYIYGGARERLSDLILFPVPVGWITTPALVGSDASGFCGHYTLHMLTHILKIIKINLKTEPGMVVHAVILVLVMRGRGRKIATIQNQPVLHGKFQPARNKSMTVLKQTITKQETNPKCRDAMQLRGTVFVYYM